MKKISLVGIGPGNIDNMTLRAIRTIRESDVVLGYTLYCDLLREEFPDKEYRTTPMRGEEERCKLAFLEAEKGKNVSLVCSGDSGVYGMAGLILGMKEEYLEVEIEIVPGVTAALSGAAILGAPLIHDFCVISLSDLLTPMDKIIKRLECAAKSDMVIVLYNPGSKKRHDYLEKAVNVILKYKSADTPCGICKNIGREGETRKILTLLELKNEKVDMFSTCFIGNDSSKFIGDYIVTPRGYSCE